MRKTRHLFQHYHPSEKTFVEKALDWVERVSASYVFEVTSFLNPREEKILTELAQSEGLQVYSSSLLGQMEYRKLILAPDYYVLDLSDFDMSLLTMAYPAKFARLTHGQVLGTLLNQLGIKRQVLGDIILADGQVQLMVDRRFAPIILRDITKIGKVAVKIEETSWDNLLQVQEVTSAQDILVSSMRLDKLVASSFQLSRMTAVKLIESGKVKVNYTLTEQASPSLTVGDLLSVRGFGRCEILSDNGLSKSGKVKLTVRLIKSSR